MAPPLSTRLTTCGGGALPSLVGQLSDHRQVHHRWMSCVQTHARIACSSVAAGLPPSRRRRRNLVYVRKINMLHTSVYTTIACADNCRFMPHTTHAAWLHIYIHAMAHPRIRNFAAGVEVPTLRRQARRLPLRQVAALFANTQRNDWRPARPTLGGHLHTLNPRRLGFHRSRFHRLFHRYQLILNDEGCFGVVSIAFCAIATSFATASPDTLQAAWAFLSSRRARASHATLATCAAAALDAIPKAGMTTAQKQKRPGEASSSGVKTLNIDRWQRW